MAIDLRWRSVSFYNDISLFPIVGSINILYVDRAAMLIYIWNGSSYEATEGGSGGSSITVVANYAALPDPTTVTASFYWCSASQGTAWLPGSLGGSYYNSGLYYSNGTTWEYMSSPYQATQVEVDAGVISDKFVTPNTLYNSSKWGTKQNPITLTTLGSGAATFISDVLNIPIASGGTPAGLTGQIQFNNGGAFGADSGLFWDNTLKRLILKAVGSTGTDIPFRVRNSADTADLFIINGNKAFNLGGGIIGDGFTTYLSSQTGVTQITASGNGLVMTSNYLTQINAANQVAIQTNSVTRIHLDNVGNVGIGSSTTLGARLDVRAQGALSTDIAFRVRNSADTSNLFVVKGNGVLNAANLPTSPAGLVTGDIWNNLGILTIV